jgi:hypothetical protein
MDHRETYHLSDRTQSTPFDFTMFTIAFMAVIICVGVPALSTYLGFTKFALGAHIVTAIIGLGFAIKIGRSG